MLLLQGIPCYLRKKSGLSNDHCTIYQHMPIADQVNDRIYISMVLLKKRKRIKKKLTSSRRNFRLPKSTRDRRVNCYDEHQIWKFHDFHFFFLDLTFHNNKENYSFILNPLISTDFCLLFFHSGHQYSPVNISWEVNFPNWKQITSSFMAT